MRIRMVSVGLLFVTSGLLGGEGPRIAVCSFDKESKEFVENNWTRHMGEWWAKEPISGVQIVESVAEADFVVVWQERSTSSDYEYSVQVPESETAVVYDANSGTFRTETRYRSKAQKRTGKTSDWYVDANVHRTSDLKIVWRKTHTGRWRWSKPDKDVLVEAIRWIRQQPSSSGAASSEDLSDLYRKGNFSIAR